MKSLYYFTIGYSPIYIGCLALSIESLKKYSNSDIIIFIDEDLLELAKNSISSVTFITCPKSRTPEEASMRKLDIFNYNIQEYESIIYIDADILVHMDIEKLTPLITSPDKLYVYTESTDIKAHSDLQWSLNTYTNENYAFFKENNISVFNTGLFGFKPSNAMRLHFENVRNLIEKNTGAFFYEQSFMNVYFNLSNNTIRNLFTDENYIMSPKSDCKYEGRIIHFSGSPGEGMSKYTKMKEYVDLYF